MTELMVHVERIIRPVPRGAVGKDKLRDEMLSHLSAAYEEEFAKSGDKATALEAAKRRFGDTEELTKELIDSTNRRQRVEHWFEKLLAWHAPESAPRYCLRLTLVISFGAFGMFLPMIGLMEGLDYLFHFNEPARPNAITALVTLLACCCAAVFPLGCLYFRIRDAMFGFGVPRSPFRVGLYAVLFGITVFALGLVYARGIIGNWSEALDTLNPGGLFASAAVAFVALEVARNRGREEIRHTQWSCLDIAE